MQIQTTAHFELTMNDIQAGLLEAAAKGDYATLEGHVNTQDQKLARLEDAQGFTLLHLAVRHGHLQVVQLLLKQLSSLIDLKSNDGFTPLHVAAQSGHLAIVELLLESGADLNAKSNNGLTPLHLAVSGDQAEIVEYFLLHGAALNVKDSFGFTPLHISAYYGLEKTTDVLLEYGADCTLRNIKGETPAKVAINNDQHGVAGLFMRKQIEQISKQQTHLMKVTEKFNQRKRVFKQAVAQN